MNKILVIVAHPDDEVLGCGAAIAKHTSEGDKVQVVFVADGFSSRAHGDNRTDSARKASKELGCTEPLFLNFPDNKLDTIPLLDIVQEIERVICKFQPSIVYTHHFGDLNIDHQVTHRAVMTACRPQPGFYVKELYSCEILSATYWQSNSMEIFFNPNYFIEVNDFIGRKDRALRHYDDEMREHPHARSYDSVEILARFRGLMVGVKYAEAFVVERLVK